MMIIIIFGTARHYSIIHWLYDDFFKRLTSYVVSITDPWIMLAFIAKKLTSEIRPYSLVFATTKVIDYHAIIYTIWFGKTVQLRIKTVMSNGVEGLRKIKSNDMHVVLKGAGFDKIWIDVKAVLPRSERLYKCHSMYGTLRPQGWWAHYIHAVAEAVFNSLVSNIRSLFVCFCVYFTNSANIVP